MLRHRTKIVIILLLAGLPVNLSAQTSALGTLREFTDEKRLKELSKEVDALAAGGGLSCQECIGLWEGRQFEPKMSECEFEKILKDSGVHAIWEGGEYVPNND